MRKSSKHQVANFDDLDWTKEMQEQSSSGRPSFIQPMNQEPVLNKRLSHMSQTTSPTTKGESPRLSGPKQPPTRPSFATDSPRDLLPLHERGAAPQLQGRTKPRQSRSPQPPAVVTPPESQHPDQSRRSGSSGRPKTRKSHRTPATTTTSNIEVSDVEQRHMHPAIQEHILAELQMAQQMRQEQEMYNSHLPQLGSKLKKKPENSNNGPPQPETMQPHLQEHIIALQQKREQELLNNARNLTGQDPNGMHEYLQEHFLAMADREGKAPGSNAGIDDHYSSISGSLFDSNRDDSNRDDLVPGIDALNRDHQQLREDRQKRHKEKKKNRKKGWFGRKSGHSRNRSPDTNSGSSAGSGFAPAAQKGDKRRSFTPPPGTGIGSRLRNSLIPGRKGKNKDNNKITYNPDAPTTIQDPLLQQSILESIKNGNGKPGKQRSRSAPRPRQTTRGGHRPSQSNLPDSPRRQKQHLAIQREIGMLGVGDPGVGVGILQEQLPEPQQRATPQHNQRKHRRTFSQPSPITVPHPAVDSTELKEIAMMFAPNAGSTDPLNESQAFLLEQQAALEALQRQRKPPPPPPAGSSPPRQLSPVRPSTVSQENRGRSAPQFSLELSDKVPPVDNEMGTPPAASLPGRAGKGQVDYCGQSYTGSRSTVPEEDDDFFDWASSDDPPPIRECITRDSVVSDITMPRGIGSDNEYYSESEEEDWYADNYDSDDYVDDDEWERLEKAMEKGGPEAERQWEEFLKKQSQQEASGPPVTESAEVQEQSRPYDGGYAPTQMTDPDDEKDPPPHVPSPPPIAQIPSPPGPQAAQTPSSTNSSLRTTFVCECCAERKSTKDHGHRCDDWDTPHLLCSGCIRRYLETPNAKFRMVESSNNQTMYQVKCFTALDGTSCNDCNAKISFDLKSVFSLADLESWLVRQRNRLHTMRSAQKPPSYH